MFDFVPKKWQNPSNHPFFVILASNFATSPILPFPQKKLPLYHTFYPFFYYSKRFMGWNPTHFLYSPILSR
jgi:hypothetical protein